MIRTKWLSTIVVLSAAFLFSGAGLAAKPEHKEHSQAQHGQGKDHPKKAHHNNGKQLLGEKIKHNGRHVLEKKGEVTAEVEVKDGKIAGLHAKHAKKGELPVTKYKTKQKMARLELPAGEPRLMTVQDEYIDTIWIGYAYYDEYGEEEIYWFPYDMILDGDTGAIDYVPAY